MKIKINKCSLSSKYNLKYKKKIRRTFKRKNIIRNNSYFITHNRINHPYKKKNINKLKLQSSINFLDDIKYINGILRKLEKCKNNSELISIDHRELKNIDNSAILYLTAGLKLFSQNKMIRRSKIAPTSKSINNRLAEIGYWEALCCNPLKYDKNCDFLQIKKLENIEKIEHNDFHADIINFFFEKHNLDVKYKDLLLDAIYEAFTNVVEHAFIKDEYKLEDKKSLFLGSYNKKSNELEFIFYDVGMGLFKSWALGRNRLAKILHRATKILGKDGTLKNICKESKSRHKDDKKRGKGLIAFKKFTDTISEKYPSYLEIVTENKQYLTKSDRIHTLKDKIRGTFIRWVVEIKDEQ